MTPRRRAFRTLSLCGVACTLLLTTPACSDDGPTATAEIGTTEIGAGASVTTSTVVDSSVSTTAATTSTSSTTTTTTLLPWQLFPVAPPVPVGNNGGSAPWISRVETTDPVVFLTIDDGIVRDPRIPLLLAEHGVPATLFLVPGAVRRDPSYFAAFAWLGGSTNSHTLNHPNLEGLSFDEQAREICGAKTSLDNQLGAVGNLFRPPYGELDSTTLKAAASCGIQAAVTWRAVLSEGNLNTIGNRPLQPGDIVLAHFRDDLYDGILTLIAAAEAQGLTIARLEDYVGTP